MGDRETGSCGGRGGAEHVEGTLLVEESEVIEELSVSCDDLSADARGAAAQIVGVKSGDEFLEIFEESFSG